MNAPDDKPEKSKFRRLLGQGKETKAQAGALLKSSSQRKAVLLFLIVGLAAGWMLSSMFNGPRRVSSGEDQHAPERNRPHD